MPGKQRPTKKGLYSCDRLGCNWSRETTLKGWQQHLRSCNKPVDHSNRGKFVRRDPYAKTKRDSDLSSGWHRVSGFEVKIVACGPQKNLSPPHFRFRHNLHALMYDESRLAVAMSFEGVSA